MGHEGLTRRLHRWLETAHAARRQRLLGWVSGAAAAVLLAGGFWAGHQWTSRTNPSRALPPAIYGVVVPGRPDLDAFRALVSYDRRDDALLRRVVRAVLEAPRVQAPAGGGVAALDRGGGPPSMTLYLASGQEGLLSGVLRTRTEGTPAIPMLVRAPSVVAWQLGNRIEYLRSRWLYRWVWKEMFRSVPPVERRMTVGRSPGAQDITVTVQGFLAQRMAVYLEPEFLPQQAGVGTIIGGQPGAFFLGSAPAHHGRATLTALLKPPTGYRVYRRVYGWTVDVIPVDPRFATPPAE